MVEAKKELTEIGQEEIKLLVPKDLVVVAGHPRSGTSLTCQLLESAGVKFPSDIGPDRYNKKGYYELSFAKELEKKLIEEAMTLENTKTLNRVVETLNSVGGTSGLKIVIIPAIFFYRHVTKGDLRAVFVFRHPADTKASMLRRGISQFRLSWFENNNAIIAAHENIPRSIVISYETLMEKKPCIKKAFKKIGFDVDLNVIKKTFRTQKNSQMVLTDDEIRLYKKLKELEKRSCK